MDTDLYQAAGVAPQAAPAPQAPPDLYAAMGHTAVSQGPTNKTSWVDDFVHQATGGLSDKLDAAIMASTPSDWFNGVPGDSWSDRYHKDLANVRGANGYSGYEASNPGWEGAKSAHAAGVIAPMLVAAPEKAAAQAVTTMGKQLVKSAKTGALFGGMYGFGGTNDESLGQDLAATGEGTVAGAAAGTALPVGLGIAKAPFRMAGRALGVFGDQGADQAAGRIISASLTGNNQFEPAPLPGMKITAGQSTNDPGLLWLERNTSQATPRGAQLAADTKAANNGAIRTAITSLGNNGNDPSKAMSDALDAVYAKRKQDVSDLWTKADVSNTGGMSGFQFNNYMKNYVGKLPIPDQDIVPKDVMATIEKMGQAKTQNLSDVQSIRSRLGSMATMAARSGDANTARVLGGMADQVESFIDMKAQNLGEKFPLYNQARAATKDLKTTFQQPPSVRQALGEDSFGADKVPVSATGDHFIHNGDGAKEDFNAYLNAIGSKDPKTGKITYDPAGLKAAQDAFTQKFLSQVSNTGLDANDQNLVSPAKMQKFLKDYGHVINSPAFTNDQRDLIANIAKASQMASRAQNAAPPGSDTFQKLHGDKFIDALVGPGASKIVGIGAKLAGAATGYLEDGKIGAGVGLIAGEKGGDMVKSLYTAPRDKVVSIITEAMHDPQLAKDLMMKASNTNAKLLPPPRRAKLFGLTGANMTAPFVNQLNAPQPAQ